MYIQKHFAIKKSSSALKKSQAQAHLPILGWTLFQKMFGGRNSMSRSTFESHNDKAKQ